MIRHALERAVGAAVVGAEHGGARHQPDLREAGKLIRRAVRPLMARHAADLAPVAKESAAETEIFLAQDDARAGAPGAQRCGNSARPAADDKHVTKGIGVLVVIRIALAGGAAKPCRTTDQRLVDPLPEGRGPLEGLVVEARAQAPARAGEASARTSSLSDGHRFWLGGFQPLVQFDRRRFAVRLAPRAGAQLDQRIRLLRAGGNDAARPVILEAAANEADAFRQQRGGKRVTRKARDLASVKAATQRLRAIDRARRSRADRAGRAREVSWRLAAAGADAAPCAPSTNSAPMTSCVRVLRVTTSQAWQPDA